MIDKAANLPGEKIWSATDIEEFEKLCAPLVKFLQTKCHPHAHILIDWDRAVLVKDVRGVGFEVPD